MKQTKKIRNRQEVSSHLLVLEAVDSKTSPYKDSVFMLGFTG
jgi:hypothetical protein